MQTRLATPTDRDAAAALLHAADLPVPAPGEPEVELRVLVEDGRVAACAGIERHGAYVLLRSIAVAAGNRGRGLGTGVVQAALARIDELDPEETFLVTLDAADFFGRLGFRTVAHDAVPAALHASPEWRLHHCAAGTWMRRSRPA